VNQEIHMQPVEPTSFFRTRAFWTGSVMWGVVLIAAWFAWHRGKSVDIPRPGSPEGSGQREAEDKQSKTLVLKQDKDGNLTIDQSAKVGASLAWDADGIADFAFTDTESKSVTKADLVGKPWIVCFVFTHCALTCPTVTKSMRELQDQLKDYDFHLVTLTVDPERDTPDVLKGYGEQYGADFGKWFFLGGDQRDIYRLIHGSFKMPVQEIVGEKRQTGFEFIHSNNIMLVDNQGVVRGKFDATKGPDMSTLRREIQKMAKPVSQGAAAEVENVKGPQKSSE